MNLPINTETFSQLDLQQLTSQMQVLSLVVLETQGKI
jgi:hypothetical protein